LAFVEEGEMIEKQDTNVVREAVGVFESAQTLQVAIDDLLSSGFDRSELSFLASESAVTEKLGHKYQKVRELEDDASVPRAVYVSPESIGDAQGGIIGALMYVGAGVLMGPVATAGGTLAAIAAAGAVGGGVGGMLGSLLAREIGAQHAQRIEEQLKHGGLLLWVRAWDAEREKRAVDILSRHSGKDVHVHALG
jgi:hypothetical protein